MNLKSNLNPFLMAYKFCLPRTVPAKKKKIKRTGTSLNVSLFCLQYHFHDKKIFTTSRPPISYMLFL